MEQLLKEEKAMTTGIDICFSLLLGWAFISLSNFILFPLIGLDENILIIDVLIIIFSLASLYLIPYLLSAIKLRKKIRQQIAELEQKQWQEIYNYK